MAERRLKELKGNLGLIDPTSDSRKIRFEELGRQWLELHNSRLKASSADRNERCLKELLRFFNGSRVPDIRNQAVILDSDLANIYGVTTKALNQAVSRNQDRFPENFSFYVDKEELRSLRSQIVTSNEGRGGRTYKPRVFTEHGALMASTVLRSKESVAMSIYIIEAFVKMREEMTANREILKRLAEIDKSLMEHDSALFDIYSKLLPILDSPLTEEVERKTMGFS